MFLMSKELVSIGAREPKPQPLSLVMEYLPCENIVINTGYTVVNKVA